MDERHGTHFGGIVGTKTINASSYGSCHEASYSSRIHEAHEAILKKRCKIAFKPNMFLPHDISSQLNVFARLIATANGNLQRIVSSWTNYPVEVVLRRNEKICGLGDVDADETPGIIEQEKPEALHRQIGKDLLLCNSIENISDKSAIYDREVQLLCNGKPFGIAKSFVVLYETLYIDAIESGRLGIGQLFRHFDILPLFDLLNVFFLATTNRLERVYSLCAHGILCVIFESIDLASFLDPVVCDRVHESKHKGLTIPLFTRYNGDSLGDLMNGTKTTVTISNKNLNSLERVLITANGNVQRLISSALNAPITVWVENKGTFMGILKACESDSGNSNQYIYERCIWLMRGDDKVCVADNLIEITDFSLHERIQTGVLDIGNLFETPGKLGGTLPHFELLEFARNPNANFPLSRKYVLSTSEARIKITEAFSAEVSACVTD